jgi:hypothetical protein|tara:strand:- start:4682 stop:5590 length:909 start_codon:yes stop_codon:yes gene_type:complete
MIKIITISLLIISHLAFAEDLFVEEKSASLELQVFCVVGDTGETTPTQSEVASSLANSDCNQIWHTGDIIYPSGIEDADDPLFYDKFLKPYQAVLEKNVPFYLTLGNHDYKKDPSAYIEIGRKNSLINYPNNFYVKKFGSICFVAFDTTIFDKLYLFYKRWGQVSWLEKLKKTELRNCTFSVAIAHHPFFSSGDREKASPQLGFFLEKHIFGAFDLYITGHNHVLADEGDYLDTRQLISGTGSLPGGSPDIQVDGKFNMETPGFLRLTFSEKGTANYEFIRSSDGKSIWTNSKKGVGLRKKF